MEHVRPVLRTPYPRALPATARTLSPAARGSLAIVALIVGLVVVTQL